jgi:methylated-DNA-protein-cysteine methyltransferase-like protein
MTSGGESLSELSFTERAKRLIKAVPHGRVVTYGQIAAFAGNPRGARQVAWILHSSSRRFRLPWHRVINGKGCISLAPGSGYELQKTMLLGEGVVFDEKDRINLRRFGVSCLET